MSDFLAAMAVMKVNYDRQGHDILQMLVPFVAGCARRTTGPISDDAIQRELKELFGLPVPRTVVKTLLHRLTRAKALVREYSVLYPVRGEIDKPEYDLSASLVDVKAKQETLLDLGVSFGERVFGITVSKEDLAAALLALVRQEVAPLAVWAIQGGRIDFEAKIAVELEQIAAQYVIYIIGEGGPDERSALEQISKGALLSGVLWSTDVIDAPDRRIRDLELFLDTTLLLRLLGLCGPMRQAFSSEMVELAIQSGVALKCFDHTRRELVGVLNAAVHAVRSRRPRFYGEAIEFMVSEGWEASDVEEVIASLDERLSDRGVEVQRRPDREARYNMDEVALRELLNQHVHYTNPAALDADVDSLASVFIIRRARFSDRMESSRALFVTTNSNLAIGSRQLYLIGEEGLRGVPLALVESQVASYLWARHPMVAENLSLNLLAMGALSVAETDPRIWLKYVEKLNQLRERDGLSDRDFTLLRQSLLARSVLLAVTECDPEAFTEDTAEFVLKHALAEHSRELQREVSEQEATIVEGAGRLALSESRQKAQSQAFSREARAVATRLVLVAGVLISVLLLAASVLSFPWPIDPPLTSALPPWVSIVLGVVAIGVGVVSIVAGTTVHGVGRALIDPLTGVLERRYRTRFAPSPDESESP